MGKRELERNSKGHILNSQEGNVDNVVVSKYDLKKLPKTKVLMLLFIHMLQISCFTFGGGFVIVNFLKKKFVDGFHWIDEEEMIDLTAIAQASPGAIAVNAAILVGSRVAGFSGMFVSVIAMILPPLVILSIISFFYISFSKNIYFSIFLSGMQAAVAAIILDLVISLFKNLRKSGTWQTYLIFVLSFVATFILKINVIYIVIVGLILGFSRAIYSHYTEKKLSSKSGEREDR